MSGLKRGTQCRLVEISDRNLIVEGNGKIRRVPFAQLDRITVCESKELALAPGDRLQLKANEKTSGGKQIANGKIVTVKNIQPDGRIQLQDERTLDANYGQYVRGYVVTSYAAQGKTADYVIFSDSAIKAATNQKQWYVTISRGRKGIEIFTRDKNKLREAVVRSGNRELTMEITEMRHRNNLLRGNASVITDEETRVVPFNFAYWRTFQNFLPPVTQSISYNHEPGDKPTHFFSGVL